MKKIFTIVAVLLFLAGSAIAFDPSYISVEDLLNKVFDSTNNALKATISGDADLDNLTADNITATKAMTADNLTVTTRIKCNGNLTADNITAVRALTCDNATITTRATCGNLTADNLTATYAITGDNLTITNGIKGSWITGDTVHTQIISADSGTLTLKTSGVTRADINNDGVVRVVNYLTSDTVNTQIVSADNSTLSFKTGGTTRAIITSDLSLGTDTVNSGAFRIVQGATAGDPTFSIQMTGNNVALRQTVGTMNLTAVGSLGINTSYTDVDTYIGSTSEGTMLGVDAGNNAVYLIGVATSAVYNALGFYAPLHIASGSSGQTLSALQYTNTNLGSRTDIFKTRKTDGSAGTVVQNNDNVYRLIGWGADGSIYVPMACISMDIDGTPGSSDMPGRIAFSTTQDGAAKWTERMRIDDEGVVKVNNYLTSDTVNTQIISADSATLAFRTSALERMRIDSAGKVFMSPTSGSGTTFSDLVVGNGSGGHSLTILAQGTEKSQLMFGDGLGTADEYDGIVRYDHDTRGMEFWTAGAKKVDISSTGRMILPDATGIVSCDTVKVANFMITADSTVPANGAVGRIRIITKDGTAPCWIPIYGEN